MNFEALSIALGTEILAQELRFKFSLGLTAVVSLANQII